MIVMKDIFQGYHKNLHNLQNDLHFSPERMKIKKIEKLVTNLHDQEENVTHTKKKIKTSIKLWISFEKKHSH